MPTVVLSGDGRHNKDTILGLQSYSRVQNIGCDKNTESKRKLYNRNQNKVIGTYMLHDNKDKTNTTKVRCALKTKIQKKNKQNGNF